MNARPLNSLTNDPMLVLILPAMVLLAAALGFIASTGNLALAAVSTGALLALLLVCMPNLMFWALVAGGMVVSGLAMLYVPQLQLVRWAVALGALAMVGMALLLKITSPSRYTDLPPVTQTRLLLAFIAVVAFSGLANEMGNAALVVGMKRYFQVAGLYFAIVMIRWPWPIVENLPRFALGVAFLQLPFVAHQVLVLVPRRVGYGNGVVPYDIVAGTFGAAEFGGGANAVLSAYLLIVVAVLFALWNSQAITFKKLMLLSLPLFVPVFLNESKVSAFYFVIIILVVMKNEIAARPGRAIASGMLLAGVLAGMFAMYSVYYSDRSFNDESLIERTIKYNFSDEQGHGEFALNRFTVLPHWAQEHSIRDPLHLLIGHGPKSSREDQGALTTTDTLATKRYPGMGIGLIAASALLWETGVIGFGLVLAMFWWAFAAAGKLRKYYEHDKFHTGVFSGLQAAVAILALSLFHKAFFVFDIGYQTIVMLLFGYIAYYRSMMLGEQAATAPAKHLTAD